MRNFSPEWLAATERCRFVFDWERWMGPRVPVMPWVAPPAFAASRRIFLEKGELREFETGESLCPNVQVRNLIYVLSGLTGRIVATLEGQTGASMALSPPGRLATGNLNFMTGRAAIGRYVALTHTKCLVISHEATHGALWQAPVDFIRQTMAYTEIIGLTDRMAFAIMGLLPAVERVKSVLLAWALYYGTLTEENGKLRVTMPAPCRNHNLADMIGASSVTIDKIFADLKNHYGFRRSGDFISLEVEALQGIHAWMRHAEGEDATPMRPKWVADMLIAAQDVKTMRADEKPEIE
ncbi:Crp/Fnr family transcriptional regulator [Sutterella sp.]|uniref:Crp/Fnr family transcriptional regulator n=1 Tax=Sutterella sp. TaxID=1981025 RepID=UPI0026DFFD3E|nr:Crp/Fnr family transcriptional regulator [Sutterella sp.]MDO5532602.1 Crp/Fnr family transcriptional regulator [Sutterella sp.]